MTNNKKLLSFIIILFIILAGSTGGIVYFAYNTTKFITYDQDTTIANLYVGGLFGNQAESQLTRECLTWRNTASVNLSYQNYIIQLDNKEFQFDTKTSINRIKNESNNKLYVNMEKTYIDNVLEENTSILKFNDFDIDKIYSDLINQTALLNYNINIDLGLYINDYENNKQVINSVDIDNLNDASFIAYKFNSSLNEIQIFPKKQFSLLEFIENKLSDSDITYTNEELSVIATGIYQLILETNFVNISKNVGLEVPYYTSPGLEANINQENNFDFSFYNPNSYSLFINISYNDSNVNSLKFDLVGLPFINSYEKKIYNKTLEPEEIYWYYESWNNETLPYTYQHGKNGYRSIIVREITDYNNDKSLVILYEDIYMPIETIIIKEPNN